MSVLGKAGLMASAVLLLASNANAAITVYTTQGAFLAAIGTPAVDTFNDLSVALYSSPLSRPLGYEISAADDLFPGSNGNTFMTTNVATNPMTFSNFTTSPTAIGAFFFSSDISGAFTSSPSISIAVTDGSGTTTEVISNPTASSFRGFTATSTIISMTVTAFNPQNTPTFYWPSVDDLHLAEVLPPPPPAVPEPASWAMMIAGFGLVGATMRRRREARAVT